MAATFPHLSLLQPSKPSLSLSPPRIPHSLTNWHKLSFSGAVSLAKRENGVVLNATFDAVEENLSFPLEAKKSNPIVVIDNYDNFTYNFCQYMGELEFHFKVYRNDELTVEELKRKNPKGVLISRGPGAPQDSSISLQTVLELGPAIPLFGVYMGLQCIREAFGGEPE